jgi:8-oxo-dGTP diphosphatase
VPFTYPFPRPAVTVDVVLFAMRADDLTVLLVRRGHAPFEGAWALPGGFVDESEPLETAALRELAEETGVRGVSIEQLGAFGDPGRDPRGHTVSVAYLGFAGAEAPTVTAGDDAAEAAWHPLRALLGRGRAAATLAFDHRSIIAVARGRLLEALRDPLRHPVARALVPPRFTLKELKHVHDAVLGGTLADRDFRAHLRDLRLVEPVGTARRTGARRDAQLFRWRRRRPPAR